VVRHLPSNTPAQDKNWTERNCQSKSKI
jgi:hypothetical protein